MFRARYHARYRRDGDPLTNLFGGGAGGGNGAGQSTTDSAAATLPIDTTSAAAATDASTPTIDTTDAATTTASATDPLGLGGLTSLIGSIVDPATATTTTTTPTTPPPASTPPPATAALPATSVPASTTTSAVSNTHSLASSIGSASSSASASATPTETSGAISKTAAAVVGTIGGLFALGMLIAFFLRRWNRRRRRAARESVNFDFGGQFDHDAMTKSEPEATEHYIESKPYAGSVNITSQFPLPPAAATGMYAQQNVLPRPYSGYSPRPHSGYSPHPHSGYPSAAQQVMYDYQGVPMASPHQQVHYGGEQQQYHAGTGALPNPHGGLGHEEDPYAGMSA